MRGFQEFELKRDFRFYFIFYVFVITIVLLNINFVTAVCPSNTWQCANGIQCINETLKCDNGKQLMESKKENLYVN